MSFTIISALANNVVASSRTYTSNWLEQQVVQHVGGKDRGGQIIDRNTEKTHRRQEVKLEMTQNNALRNGEKQCKILETSAERTNDHTIVGTKIMWISWLLTTMRTKEDDADEHTSCCCGIPGRKTLPLRRPAWFPRSLCEKEQTERRRKRKDDQMHLMAI